MTSFNFDRIIALVSSRGLRRNSIAALFQTILQILCVFLSFRILIGYVGLDGLGLWSLLMMFGGIAGSFDVSGASALARSVARADQDFADYAPSAVIHTVLLTSLAINLIIVAALLAAAPLLLSHMISDQQWPDAVRLMPWIAGMMLITPVALGISSAIDGLMRADIRAMLASAAAVIGLGIAVLAIPRFGVVGMVIAQAVQQAVVIVGGWLVLRRHVPGLGWMPTGWRLPIFRRTSGYAVKLNAIGALALLFEPLTKYCVNLSGGTAAVGVYELAARLVTQIRNLIVSSATPLIPAFALAKGGSEPYFATLLHRTQRYASIAALCVAMASLAAAPIMCLFILKHVSVEVLRLNALLTLGWSINLLSLPLYLAAQGQGLLRWNMVSHATIGITVILFSVVLIPLVGYVGVVAGVATGLSLSSAVTNIGNARMFGVGRALAHELPLQLLTSAAIALACATVWFGAPAVFG